MINNVGGSQPVCHNNPPGNSRPEDRPMHVADGVDLPLSYLTSTTGILAQRGKGKTYTGMKIAEQILQIGARLVLVDPLGAMWGIRSNAAGTGPGFPIPILGGEHADRPLPVGSGAVVASAIANGEDSVLLDLSLMTIAEQWDFMAAFAQQLLLENRRVLHLIIDEADAFAPQKLQTGQKEVLYAMDTLIRRGRLKGIGTTLITQRSAVINKNLIYQADMMIFLCMSGEQDFAAAEGWIKHHGEAAQAKELKETLARLPIGEAWFWGPIFEIFARAHVSDRVTYDSSRTPEFGETRLQPKGFADLEPTTLDQFSVIVPDPELESEAIPFKKTSAEELLEYGRLKVQIERLTNRLLDREAVLDSCRTFLNVQASNLRLDATRLEEFADSIYEIEPSEIPTPSTIVLTQLRTTAPKKAVDLQPEALVNVGSNSSAPDEVDGLAGDILSVLHYYRTKGFDVATIPEVAVYLGKAPNSGWMRKNVNELLALGYIRKDGPIIALTDDAPLAAPIEVRNLGKIQDIWRNKVGEVPGRMLVRLVRDHPEPMTYEDLGASINLKPNSGWFRKNLNALKAASIVATGNKRAWLTEFLFPEQLK